ncbi:MAG: hypothetical protein GQ532_07200 [Methylomarinum sp.]|nr:hypothetical protein [Methylomarinum sp.]
MKVCIIVGSQRSGTTLIGQILGALPGALLIDEDDGLYDWTSAWLKSSDAKAVLLERAMEHATRKYRNSNQTALANPELLVLKAPNLTFNWQQLSGAEPRPVVVYSSRDILSVTASLIRLASRIPVIRNQLRLMRKHQIQLATFDRELKWIEDESKPSELRLALIAMIKMAQFNHFKDAGLDVTPLGYEALVKDPEKQTRRVCRALSLDWNIHCLEHDTIMQGHGPGRTDRSRKIDSNSIKKWHVMDKNLVSSIRYLAMQFAQRHGLLSDPVFMKAIPADQAQQTSTRK